MYQSLYPKSHRDTYFEDRPPGPLELDRRDPLIRGLYGCWIMGEGGAPQNLVRVARNPAGGVIGNFGMGTFSASGFPTNVPDFRQRGGLRWSNGTEGIDLSVPSAFAIERTEAFSIMCHCSANVLRSGASTNYTIWANTGDVAAHTGIRFQLNWDGVSQTNILLTLSNNDATNVFQMFAAVDTPNAGSVVGFTYDGSVTQAGTKFFNSGTIVPASLSVNTLTASIIPATPIPAIGRRTLGGVINQPWKGDITTVFLWRGRVLTTQDMQIVDTNFQRMLISPSMRRWTVPAVTIGPTGPGGPSGQNTFFNNLLIGV